jgi:exonuclease III
MVKDPIVLTHITTVPSGRGIAARYRDIQLVNIYAPSGSAYKAERDAFFSTEVVLLLPTVLTPLILCGDFNCVLIPGDCTGAPNF